MKKHLFTLLIVLCLGASQLFSMTGTGSASDPYVIENETDLLTIMQTANSGTYWAAGVYIELGTDLDMSAYNSSSTPDPTGPIGLNGNTYQGNFNGKGHIISNLTITRTVQFAGLFGKVENAEIKNLKLRNVNITGRAFRGGFCGSIDGSIIYKCSVTGRTTGVNEVVGGFVGESINNSYISNCYSQCYVESSGYRIGGFAGLNTNSQIKDCYSSGNVKSSGNAVGGFVGRSEGTSSIISYCYSTGHAEGGQHVGGFVAELGNGTITEYCYSTGNAVSTATSGNINVGGFCGGAWQSTIRYCYSHGNATASSSGTNKVGGFIGANGFASPIEYCYSVGIPAGTGGTTNNVGGFVGLLYGTNTSYFSCCYWGFEGASLDDTGDDGDADPDEIQKITPEEFADPTTFAGCFNFEDGTWMMNDGYPVLTELTIPTLTEWAVIIFVGLLAAIGGVFIWRRMA